LPSVKVGGNEIDIALYADVLRRHRTIVLVGAALTIGLVVLSIARVSPSGISYRSPQIWSNQATLVLTQEGAPELRSVLPTPVTGGNSSLADTSRFAGLIDVYTTLATSDPVIRALERRGLIDAAQLENGANPISAVPVVSTVGGGTTPMMIISATAPTSGTATALTRAATTAFLKEVTSRQLAARIPVKDRIQLRVVKAADEPKLVKPRSKAVPILVLLGGLIATAGVAFTRENVARRGRAAPILTAASPDEAADSDPSVAVSHARSTLGPVPRTDKAREEPASSIGATRGRSTLGSVPRAGSSSREGLPDDVAQQAPQLRKAGTSGRPQS
jgi:hypothetical protein